MEWFLIINGARTPTTAPGKAVSSGCIFPKIIWRAHSVILSRLDQETGRLEAEILLWDALEGLWGAFGPGSGLESQELTLETDFLVVSTTGLVEKWENPENPENPVNP